MVSTWHAPTGKQEPYRKRLPPKYLVSTGQSADFRGEAASHYIPIRFPTLREVMLSMSTCWRAATSLNPKLHGAASVYTCLYNHVFPTVNAWAPKLWLRYLQFLLLESSLSWWCHSSLMRCYELCVWHHWNRPRWTSVNIIIALSEIQIQ